MRLCFRLLVTIVLFNTLNLQTPAQTSVNGSLRGRVTDTKGAAVAGATVTLTNTANNIRQTATAGEVGSYVFARVVPGSYSIVAEKTGFKQTRRGDLAIAVNEAAVTDMTLEVGSVNETITVQAGAAIVQSQSVESRTPRQFEHPLCVFFLILCDEEQSSQENNDVNHSPDLISRSFLLRLVLGDGLKLIASGIMVGLIAAFALTRLMAGLLYGVSAADPLTCAGVALLLVAVALIACFIPARHAAKTDPIVALRSE